MTIKIDALDAVSVFVGPTSATGVYVGAEQVWPVSGGFSPLDIAWDHAYWAEGPEFEALGYNDGDPVDVFPDEVGAADFVAAGGNRPLLDTAFSGGGISGIALTFDGGSQALRYTGTLMSQPNTTVLIALATDASKDLIDGTGGSSRQLFDSNSGSWRMFAGTSRAPLNGGSPVASDAAGHLFVLYFDAANSYLTLDGSEYGVAASVGTGSLGGVPSLMATSANCTEGAVLFAGFYSGELSDDDKTSLLTWSQSYYGTP